MEELERYDLFEVNYAVEKLYKNITENLIQEKYPKGYILCGQPGSGKSTLHDMICRENPNTAVINGDEYRKFHPHFEELCELYPKEAANHTQSFANVVSNILIEKLSDDGYNIIIEGTGRRADIPLKTCRDLKEKGFSVELLVMCCEKNTAWQSTIDRISTMKENGEIPRAVPRNKFDETVKALPSNVELLYRSGEFDEITLYNRDEECLYRMTQTPDRSPYKTLVRELNGDKKTNSNLLGEHRSAQSEQLDVPDFTTRGRGRH